MDWIIPVLLFGLSFFVFPVGISYFEVPKVILAEILIQLLLLRLIIKNNVGFFWIKTINKQVGIFVLFLSLEALFNSSGKSIFGNIFRLQGIFLSLHLALFLVVSSISSFSFPKPKVILGLLLSLVLLSFIFGRLPNGRFYSTLGEPNALAATSLFFLAFVAQNLKSKVFLVGIVLSLILILLSGSRSGFIGLLILLAFLFLTKWMKVRVNKAVLASLLLVLMSFIFPFLEDKIYYQSLIGESRIYKFESRFQVWKISYNASLKKPLFGWGFGNIDKAIQSQAKIENNDLQYSFVDSAHNILLDYLLQGGLIGLVIFLWVICTSIFGLIRQENTLLLSTTIALFTCLLFNPASVVTLVQFYFCLGQGLKSSKF